MLDVLRIAGIAVFCYMTGWFVLALLLRRNDIADIAWGTVFIVALMAAAFGSDSWGIRSLVVLTLVTLWGTRLAGHIFLRNRGKPEDFRYRTWREEWGRHWAVRSYLQVFLLQGLLALIICLPALVSIRHGAVPLNPVDGLGIVMWLCGFLFESVGDRQLAAFKSSTENRGKIMQTGLWRYTRHPNYFGEVLQWWGLYVMALSVPRGSLTFIGPALITFLSAFFPLPPKKGA
jgi:steroid 5-alpha reductase family enzyme